MVAITFSSASKEMDADSSASTIAQEKKNWLNGLNITTLYSIETIEKNGKLKVVVLYA